MEHLLEIERNRKREREKENCLSLFTGVSIMGNTHTLRQAETYYLTKTGAQTPGPDIDTKIRETFGIHTLFF